MSKLDWQWPLEDGEMLLWQGRPAPRCYTFRQWKLFAVGTFLFLACSSWLMLAYELVKAESYPGWLLLIPAPLVLLSFWFGPVRLLLARIKWEQAFYALSDKRLLVREGLFSGQVKTYPVTDIVDWKQKKFGEHLISLRLKIQACQPVILHCLEQPQNLLGHLQRVVNKPATNGDSV